MAYTCVCPLNSVLGFSRGDGIFFNFFQRNGPNSPLWYWNVQQGSCYLKGYILCFPGARIKKSITTLCIQGQGLLPQQACTSSRGLGRSQGPSHLQLRNEPKNAFWEPHNSPRILHLNFFLFWKMYSWQFFFFFFHAKISRWLRTPVTFWH